ncbi:hypothetical protein [Uliginosibacterium sediminicola]|uniref:Uncharacterized protein n=1 Tax=Uliginosibacterium sediminicola TaxID=2024550 RepID=A0ABU9YVZ4_9RHOO
MSLKQAFFPLIIKAAGGALKELSSVLDTLPQKFTVSVENHMPRHISLPELGLFLLDGNTPSGNKGSTTADKEAFARAITSIETIAAINRYGGNCMTLMIDLGEVEVDESPTATGSATDSTQLQQDPQGDAAGNDASGGQSSAPAETDSAKAAEDATKTSGQDSATATATAAAAEVATRNKSSKK